MHESAKKVIENLIDMVKRYGFVPNGGRKYYLTRFGKILFLNILLCYYLFHYR